MPSTRRHSKSGGGASGGSGSRDEPAKDLSNNYINGLWYCNCAPRKRAVILTTKEGENRGRKFWRCKLGQRDECKFYVWDDEARAFEREVAANQTPSSTQRFRQTRLTESVSGGSKKGTRAAATAPETPTRQRIFKGVPSAAVDDDIDTSDMDTSDINTSDTDAQMERDDARKARATAAASASAKTQNGTPSQASSQPAGGPSQQQQAAAAGGSGAAGKRGAKRPFDEFSDEDYEDPEMERRLAELTDSVSASSRRSQRGQGQQPVAAAAPETPSKPPRQRHNQQQHRRDGGEEAATDVGADALPTPVSRNSLLIVREGRERAAAGEFSGHKRVRLSTPTGGISSPTSSPTRSSSSRRAFDGADGQDDGREEAGLGGAGVGGGGGDYDGDYEVTREILDLLDHYMLLPAASLRSNGTNDSSSSSGGGGGSRRAEKARMQAATVPDPESLRSAVRERLNGWALRAEGVRKGRDLVREGIASRDARIAELQERVDTLEAERAASHQRIAEYKAAAMKFLDEWLII